MEKGDFPAPPDWAKVEKATKQVLDLFDIGGFTFTEKYIILQFVRSTMDREFNINSIMLFAQKQVEEEKLNIEAQTPYIQ